MSGPKCSSYENRAAREAREKLAADQYFDEIAREVSAFQAEAMLVSSRMGIASQASVLVPRPIGSASDVRSAANSMRAALGDARSAHRQTVFDAEIAELAVTIASKAAPVEALGERKYDGPRIAHFDVDSWDARLQRALTSIPNDVTDTELSAIRSTADAAATAIARRARPSVVTSLVDSVNQLSYQARRRSELHEMIASERAELRKQLLELPVDDVTLELFRQIDARDPGLHTADLATTVASDVTRRSALAAESDRIEVLAAAAKALADAGYQLGEDFATSTSPDSIARVEGGQHAVRVREHSGELLFNVIRVDPEGKTAPEQDGRAETRWCKDFAGVRRKLAADGIDLELRMHIAAGAQLVDVMTPQEIGETFGVEAAAAFVFEEESDQRPASHQKQRLSYE